jgi:hypothetical protein
MHHLHHSWTSAILGAVVVLCRPRVLHNKGRSSLHPGILGGIILSLLISSAV